MTTQEDKQIIERCLNEDINEFEKLIKKYRRAVFSHAYQLCLNPHTAEDIAHETFIKAYKYLKTFNPEYKFITWLYTICDNLYKDHLRKNSKTFDNVSIDNPDLPADVLFFSTTDPDEIQKKVEGKRQDEIIKYCINKLPEHYRIILVYRYLENFSYEEIADATKMPIGTIKTRIFRARALLKEMLVDKLKLNKSE